MANPFEITPADPLQAQQEWRQTIAKTASLETKAAGERAALESDQEFQAVLKKISPNLPVMEKLGQIASSAVSAGKFSEAEKAITTMSVLENRDSMAEQRTARSAQSNAAAASTRIERQLQLYSGVTNEATKRQADELYEKEFGQPAPLAKYPYSPELMRMAQLSQTKQLDGLTAALRQAQTATIYADDARAKALQDAQVNYYNARVRAVDERIRQGVKASGKLAEPKANEVRAVEAKILVDYPEMEAAEFDLAVREVAADAKEIQLREHGSFSDAMEKALDARKGQFTRLPGLVIPGLGITVGKGRSTYKSRPTGTDKPAPLPASGKASDLKAGQVYSNASGQAKRWTGSGWEDVE